MDKRQEEASVRVRGWGDDFLFVINDHFFTDENQ